MEMSQYHYLPLAPSFFAILVGIFIGVLILQSLRYAYVSLGISSGTALLLLFASLIGSVFNIPIAQLPPEPVVSDRIIDFFGMQYTVPVVNDWRGTVIAVNVGVALILSREDAAPLAYIAGALGTLIGADLTNLDKVSGLGAPVALIGGAGTFDGIFLTGILAVILANLFPRRRARDPQPWATLPGNLSQPLIDLANRFARVRNSAPHS